MYLFYLDKILLPITPKDLTIKNKDRNTTITLINDGEVNLLKSPGLLEVSFSALLPNQRYSFAKYKGNFVKADYFVSELEKLKEQKKVFQFIVTRESFNGKKLMNTNIKVAMGGLTFKESSDNGTNIIADITLKQFKTYGTKTYKIEKEEETDVIVIAQTNTETTNSPLPKESQIYTVKSGDTLFAIAKYYYGNGALYTKIVEANNIQTPNLIYPGQQFIIPV